MAAPFSVEVGRSVGNALTTTALPTGGMLYGFWIQCTGTGSRYFTVLYGDTWYLEIQATFGATSVAWQITGYWYSSFSTHNQIVTWTDTVTSGQASGWIGFWLHIVPSSTTTMRVWVKYGTGTTTKKFESTTLTGSQLTGASITPGNPAQLSIGYLYDDSGQQNAYYIDARCYSQGTTDPGTAWIDSKWGDLTSDPTAYWHWKLQYSGSADLTDSSGNSRAPTNQDLGNGNTLYQGPAGPLDPGGVTATQTGFFLQLVSQ